jgi:hypothetical protein
VKAITVWKITPARPVAIPVFAPIVGTKSVATSFSESHACQPLRVEPGDICGAWDSLPVALKDGSALCVELALPDDSHSGSFKSKVKSSDS